MAQKKDEGEFFPTTHQLLKHPLANLALVPKDAALFAAGAIAGAAAKTVSSSLCRVIIEVEDRKQREICAKEYRRRDEMDKGKLSEIDIERKEECGICMEMNSKVVLPSCNHSLCMKCYRNRRARSQSCPFCRDSLKRVNSGDLWIYTCRCEIIELSAIAKENLKGLFMYIEKLPLLLPDALLVSYDPQFR